MRATWTGLVASAAYLAAGSIWLYAARPPGPPWFAAAWFGAVSLAGVFVPGLANQMSLARAYLAAPAVAYSAAPGGLRFLAVTVAVAGLTDLVDGTVARRTQATTALGGGLDPIVDGVFLGAVGAGLAAGGAIPSWLAAVVIVRYLVPALAGAVLLAVRRPVELRHTLTGQVSTVLILVLLGGIALLRGLEQSPGNLVIGSEIVIPIATLATFGHLLWTLRARKADGSSA